MLEGCRGIEEAGRGMGRQLEVLEGCKGIVGAGKGMGRQVEV